MNNGTMFLQARRRGRVSKFTAPTMRRFLRCVARGMPVTLASSAAGVSHSSIAKWRTEYPRFDRVVVRAIARGVDARLKRIVEATSTDWGAAAWLLEHCQPQHFGKTRLEVSGTDGAPLIAGVTLFLPRKEGATIEIGRAHV